LIPCAECKKDISDRATACPFCGCPVSNERMPVATRDDSFFTRSRGCGDIVLYSPLILIVFIVILLTMHGC
jgi:hypothetical protein